MSRVRTFAIPAVLLALTLGDSVNAQKRNKFGFASFRRVEADPNKAYTLNESHGPWMIVAASFAGPGAKKEASDLIMELRKRFKMQAYLYHKNYDFSEPVEGRGLNEYGEPKMMRYQQNYKFEEYAVLIGNFPSIDDPTLQSTLKDIKYIKPTCMQVGNGGKTTQRFVDFRSLVRRYSTDPEKKQKGPMGQAFVSRNPILPQEYFTPSGFDSLVEKINSGVQYSLLTNPGKFTVRVATFTGNVVLDQRKVAEIQKTGRMKSRLTQAAEKAHRLTEALRQRGVEAYEFHDRHESIVTVGNFESVGSPREDGRIEIDRRILKVIESYGAKQTPVAVRGGSAGMQPRTLDGIPFDIQPKPIHVPKRSIASDYARGGSVR